MPASCERYGLTMPTFGRPCLLWSGCRMTTCTTVFRCPNSPVPGAPTASRDPRPRFYRQLNAPVGEFGLDVVRLITQAIKGRDPGGDAQTVHWLEGLGAERNGITTALRVFVHHRAEGDLALGVVQGAGERVVDCPCASSRWRGRSIAPGASLCASLMPTITTSSVPMPWRTMSTAIASCRDHGAKSMLSPPRSRPISWHTLSIKAEG